MLHNQLAPSLETLLGKLLSFVRLVPPSGTFRGIEGATHCSLGEPATVATQRGPRVAGGSLAQNLFAVLRHTGLLHEALFMYIQARGSLSLYIYPIYIYMYK